MSRIVLTTTPKTSLDCISCSEVNCFKDCPRKFYNSHVRMLERASFYVPFFVGHVVHYGLELWYKGKSPRHIIRCCKRFIARELHKYDIPPEQRRDVNIQKAQALGLVSAYMAHREGLRDGEKVIFTEQQIKCHVPSLDIDFVGTLDLVTQNASGKYTIHDHKTKGRVYPPALEMLKVDTQVQMYHLLMLKAGLKPKSFSYNIMVKPGIRLCKNETQSEFVARMVNLYKSDPAKYFHRVPISLQKKHRDKVWTSTKVFLGWLKDIYDNANDVRDPANWPMNTSQCFKYGLGHACEFVRLCTYGESAAELKPFKQREVRYADESKMLIGKPLK